MAGNVTPSPTPIRMRAPTSAAKPTNAAGGVSAVKSDHKSTPPASTCLPPSRPASHPPGTWVSR
jgi:hypothetical protein